MYRALLPLSLLAALAGGLVLVPTTRAAEVGYIEESALDWLAAETLTWERRRHLLQRLPRPDLPNLATLVHDDLAAPHAGGFGSIPAHFLLTLPQLEELRKRRPDLANDGNFVRAWAARLQPGADTDWRRDRAAARAFLDRLWAF